VILTGRDEPEVTPSPSCVMKDRRHQYFARRCVALTAPEVDDECC
jgi:hypothetical protein